MSIDSFFDEKDTPWKTNISPKKGTISIGNTSSNHQFSGDMLVLGSVFGNPHGQSPMVATSLLGLPQQMALPPQAISLGARPNAPLSTSRSPKMVSGIGEGLTMGGSIQWHLFFRGKNMEHNTFDASCMVILRRFFPLITRRGKCEKTVG